MARSHAAKKLLSERLISPRTTRLDIGTAGAFLREKRYQMQNANTDEDADFETDHIKQKIEQLRKRTREIMESVGTLQTVDLTTDPIDGELPPPQRPFDSIESHQDLNDLRILVMGRTALSVLVVNMLTSSGVKNLVLLESNSSAATNNDDIMRLDVLKETLRKQKRGIKVQTQALDLNFAGDREEFCAQAKQSNLVLLCSEDPVDQKEVPGLACDAACPWIKAELDRESNTFHFQYFRKYVVPVLPHDIIAGPIIEHAKNKQPVTPEFLGLVETLTPSSRAIFGSMIAASIAQFWFGSAATLGYVWYSPLFGRISSFLLSELRHIPVAQIGT